MTEEVFLSESELTSNARVSQRVLPIIAVAIAAMCTRVHAERVVRVLATGAPFSADDLVAALRVRLPAAGAPVAVHVSAAAGGRVTVAIGDTARDVELAGRSGPDAARLVALEIVDLAFDDLAVVPHADPPRELAVAVLGSATAWTSTLAGGNLDIALSRGRWLGALEVAGVERVSGDLGITSVPVRLSGGLRFEQLELRAGAVIAPVWVSNGAGDQTMLLGATASARMHVGARLIVAVGLDAYGTQTKYELGMTTVTTPWIAPWIAAGMELVP